MGSIIWSARIFRIVIFYSLSVYLIHYNKGDSDSLLSEKKSVFLDMNLMHFPSSLFYFVAFKETCKQNFLYASAHHFKGENINFNCLLNVNELLHLLKITTVFNFTFSTFSESCSCQLKLDCRESKCSLLIWNNNHWNYLKDYAIFSTRNFSYVEYIFFFLTSHFSFEVHQELAAMLLVSLLAIQWVIYLPFLSVDFRLLFAAQFQFVSLFLSLCSCTNEKKNALRYLCQVSYICIWVNSGGGKVWVKI